MGQIFTKLAAIARETGYPVIEVPGWRTRHHGAFSDHVGATVCHHTAGADPEQTRSNYPSLNAVKNGVPGLAGPLSNFGLGFDGTIYVIASGTCWHAGRGGWAGMQYNSQAIGIEAEDAGDGDWTAAQLDCYPRLCAVITRFLGIGAGTVCGHKEWCSPPGRKIDPAGINMRDFRGQVGWYLKHQNKIKSGKAPSGGDGGGGGGGSGSGNAGGWPLDPGEYFGPADGPAESIGGYYSPNPHVRRIQQRFQQTGHAPNYAAWADGVWEPPTTKACKDWERAVGQRVDGIITKSDWYKLFPQEDEMSEEAERKINELHDAVLGRHQSRIPGDKNTTSMHDLAFDSAKWMFALPAWVWNWDNIPVGDEKWRPMYVLAEIKARQGSMAQALAAATDSPDITAERIEQILREAVADNMPELPADIDVSGELSWVDKGQSEGGQNG